MIFESFPNVVKVLGVGLIGLGLAGPGSFTVSGSQAHAAEPNAVMTIVNVQCISTSSATDTSSAVLVGAIGAAVAAQALGGLLVVEPFLAGGLAGAGAVQLGSYFPGLDDDLFIQVEGHGVDGNIWESPTREIGSQETRAFNRSFPFDLDEGITITLFDYDVASGNDNLGAVQLNGDTLDRLPFADEIVVNNEGEGSVYLVSIELERL